MKKILPILLALFMTLPLIVAQAQSPVEMAEPLTGVYTWPEGADEADALYVYRYSYPQVAGDNDMAIMINDVYTYAVDDALGFEVPMLASEMVPGDAQKVVDITYDITCQNADFLSVRICKTVSVAGETTQVISGHVFSLQGANAGRIINLPFCLGLLNADDTNEWLITRQTNKADKLVRELVWAQIQAGGPYYEDLTYEELEFGFYPEEDFYLCENGDLCFYFQAGIIAPEEEGLMTFTFPLWLLLDEM